MIRLIVSDIDRTLTEDGGSRLDPELYEVIPSLRARGSILRLPAAVIQPALNIFLIQ